MALLGLPFLGQQANAAGKPIVLGAPLSTAFLYGWDAERGIKLAVEEINAKGGVKVGKEKRLFKVEVMDTRDLEPGVPTSDALLVVEKLILEKKLISLLAAPSDPKLPLQQWIYSPNIKRYPFYRQGF